ncbi:MAG: hypothetical protein MdMp014T_2592 [Treponematales bacterium]
MWGALGLIRCSPSSILFGPSSEIRLSSKSASLTGDRWEYDEAADTCKILDGAVVQVSGSTASSRIIIEGTAAVTLESASVILDADGACPIDIESGAAAEIILSGTSRLSAGPGAAAIHVPGGSMLTISGAGESGALNVTGGLYSADIGGGSGETGGVIQIDSGEVAASGGYLAATIGGGFGEAMAGQSPSQGEK